MKQKFYHASIDNNIKLFDNKHNKASNDFGPGLYITDNIQQAIDRLKTHKQGVIYESEIDINNSSLIVKNLWNDEESCKEYMYLFRLLTQKNKESILLELKDELKDIDIFCGPMLSKLIKFDKAVDIFHGDEEMKKEADLNLQTRKYEIQKINCVNSFDDLMRHMEFFKNEFNQYCLRSDKAIDMFNKGILKINYIKDGNIEAERKLVYDFTSNEIKYLN